MIFDRIENAKNYACLGPLWKEAFEWMERYDPSAFEKGKTTLDNGLSFVQIEAQTRAPETMSLEAHRKFADIMFLAQGEEALYYKPAVQLTAVKKPYDESIDAVLTEMNADAQALHLTPGSFAVFFPQDGHGADGMWKEPQAVRRIVIKVPLN